MLWIVFVKAECYPILEASIRIRYGETIRVKTPSYIPIRNGFTIWLYHG